MTMIQFATTSRQAVFMPITHKFQTSTIGFIYYSVTETKFCGKKLGFKLLILGLANEWVCLSGNITIRNSHRQSFGCFKAQNSNGFF